MERYQHEICHKKSCPCFSFWAEKVFVWSWSVVGGQQCSAAATNRNDRGQSPPLDFFWRKSNEAFPFSRDIFIVLWNSCPLFPLWICELIAEAFVVRSEAGGRKILHMHRFLWNAHSWTAYAKSTGEKSVKLWIVAVMAQTGQISLRKKLRGKMSSTKCVKCFCRKWCQKCRGLCPIDLPANICIACYILLWWNRGEIMVNAQILTYGSLVTMSFVYLVSLVLIYAHMSRYFLALNFRFGSFPHVYRPFLLCT